MSLQELQSKFDELTVDDFTEIANSCADNVKNGQIKERVLVNLSQPDVMIFDPICYREYKHLKFEIHGRDILIMIGLD